jgi:hypothetical protein
MATFEQLLAVKRRHAAELLRSPGVSGVDVETDARGRAVIAVHLDTDDPEVIGRLPVKLEGHRVKFVHTGPIRKQTKKEKDGSR